MNKPERIARRPCRDIERRTAAFLAELDPLLAERPIYPILLNNEIPPLYHPHASCAGWTSPWADLWAQPILEEQGRWEGRGFCFFMEPPPRGDPDDWEWLGMCVHEAGHYMTFAAVVCDYNPERELPEIQKALEPLATPAGFLRRRESSKQIGDLTEEASRRGHPPDWIRATYHLWQRTGNAASLLMAAATDAYGYATTWLFSFALQDEAYFRRDERIRDILASPPPKQFTELVSRDPDTWSATIPAIDTPRSTPLRGHDPSARAATIPTPGPPRCRETSSHDPATEPATLPAIEKPRTPPLRSHDCSPGCVTIPAPAASRSADQLCHDSQPGCVTIPTPGPTRSPDPTAAVGDTRSTITPPGTGSSTVGNGDGRCDLATSKEQLTTPPMLPTEAGYYLAIYTPPQSLVSAKVIAQVSGEAPFLSIDWAVAVGFPKPHAVERPNLLDLQWVERLTCCELPSTVSPEFPDTDEHEQLDN